MSGGKSFGKIFGKYLIIRQILQTCEISKKSVKPWWLGSQRILMFKGNKWGRVKLLGKVFKKSGKFLRQVLKKVGKVQVRLNKIGLQFSWGKMLVTCQKLSHFSPTFSLDMVCNFYRLPHPLKQVKQIYEPSI